MDLCRSLFRRCAVLSSIAAAGGLEFWGIEFKLCVFRNRTRIADLEFERRRRTNSDLTSER